MPHSIPSEILFKQIPMGSMDNFVYLIGDSALKQVFAVDPSWDGDRILREVDALGAELTGIFLTHGHYDHTNAIEDLLRTKPLTIYVSKYERIGGKNDLIVQLEDHDKIKIGDVAFEAILTPGHSPGSQCLLYKNILITGDTLFIDGCGRCDLAGGNPRKMYHSLYEVICQLPDATLIFPGHDYGPTPYASLGEQKKTNPYLTCTSEQDFLKRRMGMTF